MRRFNSTIFFILLFALSQPFVQVGFAQTSVQQTAAAVSTSAAGKAAEQITAGQLKDYLYFVAADEMEGRDTPSRGLDLTAKFIAMNLSRWGVKPAGDDGTYFQKIALQRTRIAPEQSRVEINGQKFNYGEAFLSRPVAAEVSGQLVYAGHGWVVNGKNINPYAGIDVKDKIIIVNGYGPRGINSVADLGAKQGVDWFAPTDYAKKHGAKAVISFPLPEELANWNAQRRKEVENGDLGVERFDKADGAGVPHITVLRPMIDALFQGEKVGDAEFTIARLFEFHDKGFALSPAKQVSMKLSTIVEKTGTQNVVGVIEGKDPVLKNEYVAIGAHYDHVGTGQPSDNEGKFASTKDKNDTIWNGADDDGSGTVAVLAMAQAFASGPRLKRSLLFVWHAGEEKGLWGARYFTETPSGSINIKQVVAQLNIDMIGRRKPDGDTNPANKELAQKDEIYVIGSKMMSTELGDLSERVNRGYLNLKFNYKYDDPKDPNQFFFRSDHFHYAQRGVPVIFYTDGEHEDYHRPSDAPDRIDYEQMLRVTRTIFMTASELADIPTRPQVDKKLPFDMN
jgi:Zn-dependent M28 family amino/carboxypeptidase